MLIKIFTLLGALAGCAGVSLGALSAHALRQRIDAAGLATLDTVSRYLLVHALLLIVIGCWLRAAGPAMTLHTAGLLAAVGIAFFCGGLALAVLSGQPVFAHAAPFGGVALMGAWLALACFAVVKL